MLTHFFVVLVAIIGGLGFDHGKLWICIFCGCSVVGLVYLLALPTELPIWPAVLVVGISGLIGLSWERR
ncbi:MAG: hypothetical protein ACOH2K_12220 [Burkholderiaceae bacterium]